MTVAPILRDPFWWMRSAKATRTLLRFRRLATCWRAKNNSVTVILSSLRDGQTFYGAQFIANRESEFTSYYDAELDENTAEAAIALKQFQDKKPCWSDDYFALRLCCPAWIAESRSQVQVRSPAFLEGQLNVVRAVYADDICDFGATFIDARELPSLEADYPDVMDQGQCHLARTESHSV